MNIFKILQILVFLYGITSCIYLYRTDKTNDVKKIVTAVNRVLVGAVIFLVAMIIIINTQ